MGSGQGVGLTNRVFNQRAGAETHTLTISEIPSHSHGHRGLKPLRGPSHEFEATNDTHSNENDVQTASTGGSQPHNNMPPFHVLTYIMKL